MTRIPSAQSQPNRNEPTKPRRVRGGKRLRTKERPVGSTSIGRPWMALVEQVASEEILSEGFEYGTLGQVAAFDAVAGGVNGRVQGRQRRPYQTRLILPAFSQEEWDRLIERLSREAGNLAALLDGRITDAVIESMSKLELPLLPTNASEVSYACTCIDAAKPEERIRSKPCKHAAALAFVVAEHLDAHPMTAFAMRGMEEKTLLDRLRLHRLAESGGGTAEAVHDVDLHEVHDPESARVHMSAESFWQTGPELNEVTKDLINSGMPQHALLRRLGQSPFVHQSRFPMVGLLATCYDIVSESARREQMGSSSHELSEDDDRHDQVTT